MAGTKANLTNSAALACAVGATKTHLQYSPPSGVGGEIPRVTIGFDGTSSSAAKVTASLVRGATGGTGTTVNPVAAGSTNPSGVSLGSGKENFTVEPTGGTEIWSDVIPPYGNFPVPIPPGLVLAPGETLGVRLNAGASVNARVNFPGINL